ncbi:MAG TPA: TonB-dependent receptor [Candidatus Polarisedimenticolia bacterium]|jgi:iron complex outermembrane receptor protein|nr:TonB-dependent receptor [Candidatus Polarisedimenticolia bacterium]
MTHRKTPLRFHPGRLIGMALLAAFGDGGRALCQDTPPDLTTLGIEAVMNMEVTSVSKKPERLMDAAAAVQVITSEDIRRSAATTLPDLLRLVPGVQVARVNSSTWAVGVRGFTSTLSRSLLVLIDGRSVYSPLFAGVYWDVLDVPLNDIERIEVIRGPGATLWGTNAVNGVINIITRSAQATQGTYASLRGGNEDRAVATGRFGGKTAGGLAFRAYGKFSDRDAEFHQGTNDYDGWNMGLAGFRADADPRDKDHVMLQGDFYSGNTGQRVVNSTYTAPYFDVVEEDGDLSGGHLLGQWKHEAHEDSDTTLQAYIDRTHRAQPNFRENRNTLDFDFRHRRNFASRHEFVWGAGYRLTMDDTESVPTIEFDPASRTDDVFSAFVQDEIRIVPSRWTLTLGSKFEHNDYSGFNSQPNVRLLFVPASRHVLWSAVSRALRVPSRLESDLSLTALLSPATPTFVRLTGTKDFQPERLTAYEIGYRVQPTDRLFVDLALFHNDYARLLSLEPGTLFTETTPPPSHDVIPYFLLNRMRGDARGAEVAAEWHPAASIRLTGSYSYLDINLQPATNSVDTTTEPSTEGGTPQHLANVRSWFDLPWQLGLDVTLRYAGRLESTSVDAYTEMDLVIRRDLPLGFEVSLAGQNLLSRHHREFGGASTAIEVERSLYGRLVRRW